MGLFSRKPKQTEVEELLTKSKNVFNIFTRTMDELRDINNDVDSSVTEKTAVKNQLEKDIMELNDIRRDNEKVICNIQKIMT